MAASNEEMAAKPVVDARGLVGKSEGPYAVSYTSRDLLLYALGIGATEYAYEGAPDFAAFPTYPLVLPYKGTSSDVVPFPGRTLFLIPEALRGTVDPGAILHYDQSIEIVEPLDPGGAELQSWSVVLGVYRRRGGVLLRTKTVLKDGTGGGRTVAETTQGTFMRGLEIIGDAGPPLPPRPTLPTEPPDAAALVTVSPQQALLYRLSGDYNAIHADPEAARAAGLEKPVLHGLCSLGIAARQVLRCFSPEDPSGLVSLYCRFSRTVLPGDVLEIKMWGEGEDALRRDDHRRSCSKQGIGGGNAGSEAPAVARAVANETRAGRNQQQRQQQQQVVRFEVCSPRQAGAVVVADGRAVVKRRSGGGAGRRSTPNRARL